MKKIRDFFLLIIALLWDISFKLLRAFTNLFFRLQDEEHLSIQEKRQQDKIRFASRIVGIVMLMVIGTFYFFDNLNNYARSFAEGESLLHKILVEATSYFKSDEPPPPPESEQNTAFKYGPGGKKQSATSPQTPNDPENPAGPIIPETIILPGPTETIDPNAPQHVSGKKPSSSPKEPKTTAPGALNPKNQMTVSKHSPPKTEPPLPTKEIPNQVVVDNLRVDVNLKKERKVFAELVNYGHKQLVHVEIRILFLNADGKTIFQRSVKPLVVSGGLFGDRSMNLEANKSRTFSVRLDDVPPEWAGGLQSEINNVQYND